MLNEVRADYVRTAMAKGVSEGGILFKHVLKNAMIPILTTTVLSIPFLITGSLLLEMYFGIPGMGNLLLNAINNARFPDHQDPGLRLLPPLHSREHPDGYKLHPGRPQGHLGVRTKAWQNRT